MSGTHYGYSPIYVMKLHSFLNGVHRIPDIVRPGRKPKSGTHALIIGVSDYSFASDPQSRLVDPGIKVNSLSSAAKSASDVAAWLLAEYHSPKAPLASMRVLLSPSRNERINRVIRPLLDPKSFRANSVSVGKDVMDFMDECKTDPDGVVFVYIAGHGVQTTTRGAVVLLSDVGDPGLPNLLSGALDVSGLHQAMNSAGYPKDQIWFSDACRLEPTALSKFASMTAGISPDIPNNGHVDSSALVLSASTGEQAFARARGTLFSEALLAGLRGASLRGPDASSSQWYVGLFDLITWIDERVKKDSRSNDANQSIDPSGRVLGMVVQRFQTPPDVDVTLRLVPRTFTPTPIVVIDAKAKEIATFSAWPARGVIPAGRYRITVHSRHNVVEDVEIKPPKFVLSLKVEP